MIDLDVLENAINCTRMYAETPLQRAQLQAMEELYQLRAGKSCDSEDAEEQGLLLRLPCKVGHKVYTINCSYDCKHDFDCIEIEEFKCEAGLRCKYQRKEYNVVETEFQVPKIAALGETVFLTLEEAEQALKEMKEHG